MHNTGADGVCTDEEAGLPLLPDSSASSEQATSDIRGYAFCPTQRSPAQILEAYFYLLTVRLEPVRSLLKQPGPSGGAEVPLPPPPAPNDMGGMWG